MPDAPAAIAVLSTTRMSCRCRAGFLELQREMIGCRETVDACTIMAYLTPDGTAMGEFPLLLTGSAQT